MSLSRFGKLKIIVTNSHPELGLEIAKILGTNPIELTNKSFDNGEMNIRKLGDTSGDDIFIVSSLHSHYNTIGELKRIINAVSNASRICGIFPFVKDGKADHVKRYGEAVSYEVVAHDISSSGIEVAAIFDQHTTQHPYFYDKIHYRLRTVHHLFIMKVLIEHAQQSNNMDVIAGLDQGSYKTNALIADYLGIGLNNLAFVYKYRDPTTREIDTKKSQVIGNVKGKHVVTFDDMIQRGGTTAIGAQILKNKGAKSVTAYAVHPDFGNQTFRTLNPLLEKGILDKLIILETVPIPHKEKWHKNMTILSPAKFISRVIEYIHFEKHMRDLFIEIH